MNRRLKKLTALLLSIVMVFSMVTEAFPAAFAAGEGGDSAPVTQAEEKNLNFGASGTTRRPGLYVDFLGDNKNYRPPEGERDKLLSGGYPILNDENQIPGLFDQSKVTNGKSDTNPNGTTNTWEGYKQNETYASSGVSIYDGQVIFWVGVGIDRMNLLELFKEKDNGIYGAELGFYYDSRYIEPYTGQAANDNFKYREIIEGANLKNYESYQWDGYRIVDAQTDLKPQTDPVTQEVIQGPDMDEIMGRKLPQGVPEGGENPWRMTYVSIEKTDVDKDNRYKGLYNDEAEEDLGTKYLLIIPFVLKQYDPNWQERVCLRLTRSAGLLSIGSDKGDTPYTAWERVTTRNPGHELKLMTNFQGDLNIFSGGRYLEDPYSATLLIRKAGGDNNSAKLTIQNDPSPTPVVADTDGDRITGLYGGTGMQLDVYVDTGYTVTVKVYYTDAETTSVSYVTIPKNDNDMVYTFVMPEHNVTVEVIFEVTGAEEFRLYLSEEEQDAGGNTVDNAVTGIQGNSAVLTASYIGVDKDGLAINELVKVDKNSPRNNARNLPAEMVHFQATVTANIQVHHDYEAVVWVENLATGGNIAPIYDPANDPDAFPADGILNPDNTMILPTGGQITVSSGMPESDVVVYVIYRPAKKYAAILEVHHKDILPREDNVAQLATTAYTKENTPQAAYSGVVYQDDNETNDSDGDLTAEMADDDHRAVKPDFRVLDRVDVSSAAGSGSLGGDGRAPMAWPMAGDDPENSLMALLYKATAAADLNTVKPLDLRWETTAGSSANRQPENGLRKNALGERYTDQEMTDFYDRLMEIKALADAAIAASATPGSDPVVNALTGTAMSSGGTATTYSYYDLTRAQVQAYLLDRETYLDYLDALDQYNEAYDLYTDALKDYNDALKEYNDKQAAGTLAPEDVPPVPPVPPTAPTVVDPPALKTKTDAQTQVDGHTWYTPSAATDPATRPSDAELAAGQGYRMEIRGGRQVAVVLEAESTYTVASSIVIRPAVDDGTGTGNLVASPDRTRDIVLTAHSDAYQNEFLFDMPEYDCIVEVTYTERKARELTLKIVGDYFDGTTPVVVGNHTTVDGYGPNPNPAGITATAIVPSLEKNDDKANVLEDSIVTVRVRKDEGYSVTALVEYMDGTTKRVVATDPSSTVNLADDTLFTFQMPKGAATVTITYTDNRQRLNAHLIFSGDNSPGNGGYWQANSLADIPALEGEHLVATITVAPGSYIYAVEAYTHHGAFPFTIDGNGWNNGLGGQVTLDTDMPDEEYWVHVVFRAGPPDPEPGQFLTLIVKDPDNRNTPLADNRAQVTVPTATPTVTLGPLGLVASPSLVTAAGDSASQRSYVAAGETVRLDFSAAAGYFVDAVEIQPSGLGASLTWTSATSAEFIMPAASAAVVVTFRRRTNEVFPDRLFLNLAKTVNGVPVPLNDTTNRNRLVSFTSPTLRDVGVNNFPISTTLPARLPDSGTTGAAQPGEIVEINLDVAPGYYIHSITLSGDQGRIPYEIYRTYDRATNTGVKYDPYTANNGHFSKDTPVTGLVATFVMPDSDAYVTVNYRSSQDDPPKRDESEHEVELVVEDPENRGTGDPLTYADNWASAVIDGDAGRTIAPVGKTRGLLRRTASARAGEEVVIEYAADTGYALEIILVTPSGLKVPVNYLGGNKAKFTMPDSSVTAIVRFREEPAIRYTANLVLHFPSGTDISDYDAIGEGSFVTALNGVHYDLTRKLYSLMAMPGDRLDFDMFAHDGYYIRAVSVGPEVLGVPTQYTGSFGYQSGYVIMPAANIQINVYFERGWPDDLTTDPTTVKYDLTLEVYDASGSGSTANFESIAGTALTAPDSDPVGSGQSRTILQKTYDEDRVVVKLAPAPGCYAKTITVTDSRRKDVPWQYVPGGIAFEMVPAHVTVTVKYDKLPEHTTDPDDPDNPYKSYEVMLHVKDAAGNTAGTAMGSAVLTGPEAAQRADADGESFWVTAPPQGQTLTLAVTAEPDHYVVAAYAVKRGKAGESPEILPLVAMPGGDVTLAMPQVPSGGTVTLAMPEGDADVYVIFADSTDPNTPGPDPTRGDLPGTLIVSGPAGAGSAVMKGDIVLPGVTTNVTTGTVSATGAGSLYAPQGTPLTVDLNVNTGYSIAAIRVTDGYGKELPYTWTDGTQRQFALAMAVTGGVRVYVELEKTTPRPDPNDPTPPDPNSQLTAQVVVNNGGNAGNTAILRYGPRNTDGTIPAGTVTGALLTPVYAGDQIWVDMQVAPGYQIEYVKVTPAKYGIDPTLYAPLIQAQSTSFVMPGEDVVVYVKFSRDTRQRRDVTLIAASATGVTIPADSGNWATVTTAYSGTSGQVQPPAGTPDRTTARAAGPTSTLPAEWVTVDFAWVDGYYITSIVVRDAAGNSVPFTQRVNDPAKKGQITFPMVDANVTVTVTWGVALPKYEAVLHVIDLDDPAANQDSWGKLTWLTPPVGDPDKHETSEVKALPTPGGTETLLVPAGETVRVDAHAQDEGTASPTYIQAAFVLWRAEGQMVRFDFDPDNAPGIGFTGDKNDTFVMQPGRNDVYIYYTKEKPVYTDYAAVLMLDSPDADKTSTATIERTRAGLTVPTMSDTVTANDTAKTHGYVTATDGDTITVTVSPAPGFTIDSVLMTPLGTSSDQGGPVVLTRVGNNTYTFTMPAHNVAVRVKLREGNEQEYKATLHYGLAHMDDNGKITLGPADTTRDWAEASFTWGGITTTWQTDGDWRMVPESTTVTVGASITGTDYVFAAYVLRENGDMVALSTPLEGLTETDTPPNPLNLDGTSSFTMPAADVHIYVWFIDKKPADNWRTAVLTVFDSDPNDHTQDNSGLNSATLESSNSNKTPIEVWSTGVTGRPDMPEKLAHQFIWVAEGETVSIKTKTIADGYSFESASLTHSRTGVTQGLDPATPTGPTPYTFTYTVGAYNSATVVRYVKSPMTRNKLHVVLIDADNPGTRTATGDWTVDNWARVSPMGMTALNIHSVTPAGARQAIPDVRSGISVPFQIFPDTGYTAVARLKDSTGAVIKTWPLGTASDSFDMPNGETTLEITYFRSYKATLSVVYTGDKTATGYVAPEGQMVESAFGTVLTTTADDVPVSTMVPNRTLLTANLTSLGGPNNRLIGAILTTADGSWWISAVSGTLPEEFIHRIDRKDAEITLVVGPIKDPDDPDKWDYLASVSAVNLPAGTAAPQIHVTPTANPVEGPGWTVAVPGNEVTVTVKVPDGYEATLTTDNGTALSATSMTADGVATFTMPARNTHVTVRYRKTIFEATLRIVRPTGMGTASLSDRYGPNTITVDGAKLTGLKENDVLDYTAAPDTGYVLKAIFATTASGVTTRIDTTGVPGTYNMPAEDVTITVIFDEADPDDPDPKPKHHIAYVTTVGTDGLPNNAAQNIENKSEAALDTAYGILFTYADGGNSIFVEFTTESDYTAIVTAKRIDTGAPVPVTQQGITGPGTATLTMVDADVEVIITYYGPEDEPPKDQYDLTLRLVGHDRQSDNHATLTGNSISITASGGGATGLDPVYSNSVKMQVGTPLDLDAWRGSDYIFDRMTVAVWNNDPSAPTLITEVDLDWNEYLTNGVSLLSMPNAHTLVTVYYRLPYEATLFVVDTAGRDYNDGAVPAGPADTMATPQDRTPSVTMSVDRTDLAKNSTTMTHDPIGDLNGTETVTTQVDLATMPATDRYNVHPEIASVIATTPSGTVHLLETALNSGTYEYSMADLPGRPAADVDITVILRDKDAEKKMYTATVYKVGHDDKPGNTATITNPTTAGLPSGTIWTGAYEKDEPMVTVTTEPGYYAIVTAVRTGLATNVPVLQWTAVGTAAAPIEAIFKMPAHDVDVTVTYVKTPPEAAMKLTLEDHGGKTGNKGDLYKDATATPDLTVTGLTAFLSVDGSMAPMVPIVPTPTEGPLTEPENPYSRSATADVGDYLALASDHATGYYIKSITFKAAGFEFDMLDDPTFVPRVPVSGGEIVIEFAPGKQSGRPYDPEHAERYNGENVWTWTDPADSANTKSSDYITGDKADGNPNPDLSVAPMAEQQGWILAEKADSEKLTVVVTVPTLYDQEEDKLREDGTDDRGKAALYHAGAQMPKPDEGADPATPPAYKFYWWDGDNSKYEELVQSTDGGATGDILIEDQVSLSYDENSKGDFPKDSDGTVLARHYGYQLTLKALGDPETADPAPLIRYIREGGEIYVTATRPGYVPKTNTTDPDIPWVESEKTQVIIEPSETFVATLHIVDTSSSLNNQVKLWVDGDTDPHNKYGAATEDGKTVPADGKTEKLVGKEILRTDVDPDNDVKVVAVMAIPSKGSPIYLSPDLVNFDGDYPYEMPRDDVDIVVVLSNPDADDPDHPEKDLFTATVVKVDPDNAEANTVAISNPTHPTLNRDYATPARWTAAYAGDEIQVDITAGPEYLVTVEAKTVSGATLDVTQSVGGGAMIVTLTDKMPHENVEIVVTFTKIDVNTESWLTLRMQMVDDTLPVDPGNYAAISGGLTLTANAGNGYRYTHLLTGSVTFDLKTTLAPGYAIDRVELDVSGYPVGSPGTSTDITGINVLNGDAVLTVFLKEVKVADKVTPRPFDPTHSAKYPDSVDHIDHADHNTGPDGHQDGYLMANNLGNSQVRITVPNLYDGDGLHTAENVRYSLYAKIGGVMVPIVEGVDYDTIIPTVTVKYEDAPRTADGVPWTSHQVFTIQSLDPTSALGDYVKNGGIIYITATAPGKDESGYTEVVIPADPKKDDPDDPDKPNKYTVTLKIIDDTLGTTHNEVRMQNANNWKTVSWVTTGNATDTAGSITGLMGGELIRTDVTVKAEEGVIYTVMAHTATMGDVLLYADPDGTIRYPKDMPTEDMDIIVHFHAKEDEEEDRHRHIAAVQKRGATGVLEPPPGNDATISNETTSGLRDGTIWTEAHDDDKIRVKVTTAPGFYATVTMSYVDPDPAVGLVEKTLVVMGSGNPDPLLVTFDMPHADVQVVVWFLEGRRSPRPYDPMHSELYYVDKYQHNTADDVSTTHQEGWLLGENLGGGRVVVTIPTLWGQEAGLEDADNAAFTFYLREKDDDGKYTDVYIPLVENVDYTLAHYDPKYTGADVFTVVTEDYRYIQGDTTTVKSFTGVKFMLKEIPGGKLEKLLDSGLSLFVSATKLETAIPPWVEGETTELVIPSTGLRPFDPENENPEGTTDPIYRDHWITSENRGDYLIVTVPLLNSPNEDDPTEVNGDIHRFQLHLQVDGADRNSAIVNVTELLKITNIKGYDNFWNVNMEYDPTWSVGTPTPNYLYEATYENEIYNDTYLRPDPTGWEEGKEKWHGARFIVEIMTDEELEVKFTDPADYAAAKANADILRAIFDNEGTMNMNGEEPKPHRMYITSDEVETVTDDLPEFRAMDYVDFEVPRYYSLTGELQSWAPTHVAELMLYRANAAGSGYEPMPWLVLRSGLCETMSSTVDSVTGEFDPAIYNGHWSMNFVFKSSRLADPTVALTYKMVVVKTAHIVYTHKEIALDSTYTAQLYDSADLVFSFASPVSLFAGDIAPTIPGPDQKINDRDRNILAGFNYGTYAWNNGEDSTALDWEDSTFNPNSYAYAADLNGDGIISERDMNILMSEFNWMRREKDYGTPTGLDFGGTGIVLLMEEEEPIEENEAESEEGEAAEDAVEAEDVPPEEEEPIETEEPEEGDGSQAPEEPQEPEEGSEPQGPEDPEIPDPEDGEDTSGGQTPEDGEDTSGGQTPEDGEDTSGGQTPEDPKTAEGTDPEEPEEGSNPHEPEDPTEPVTPPDGPEDEEEPSGSTEEPPEPAEPPIEPAAPEEAATEEEETPPEEKAPESGSYETEKAEIEQ